MLGVSGFLLLCSWASFPRTSITLSFQHSNRSCQHTRHPRDSSLRHAIIDKHTATASPKTPVESSIIDTGKFPPAFAAVALVLLFWFPPPTAAAVSSAPTSMVVAADQEDASSLLDAFGAQLMQQPAGTAAPKSVKIPEAEAKTQQRSSPAGKSGTDVEEALQQIQKRKRIDPRTHG